MERVIYKLPQLSRSPALRALLNRWARKFVSSAEGRKRLVDATMSWAYRESDRPSASSDEAAWFDILQKVALEDQSTERSALNADVSEGFWLNAGEGEARALKQEQDEFFDHVDNNMLSPRLIKVLLGNRIAAMSTLRRMSDEQILLLRNVGPEYLNEIRERLRRGR